MRREIKNKKKTINRHCWSHFFCPHHTFRSSPNLLLLSSFAYPSSKPLYELDALVVPRRWARRIAARWEQRQLSCSGVKKLVTRLHIHTPPHHSSHTRVVFVCAHELIPNVHMYISLFSLFLFSSLSSVATYTQTPCTATWPTCYSGYWRMIWKSMHMQPAWPGWCMA